MPPALGPAAFSLVLISVLLALSYPFQSASGGVAGRNRLTLCGVGVVHQPRRLFAVMI
jgi:hypothetical protein